MTSQEIKQEFRYTLCRLSFIKQLDEAIYWILLKDLVDFTGFCVDDIYLYMYKPDDFGSVEHLESVQTKIIEYVESDRFFKMQKKNNIELKIKVTIKKGA